MKKLRTKVILGAGSAAALCGASLALAAPGAGAATVIGPITLHPIIEGLVNLIVIITPII